MKGCLPFSDYQIELILSQFRGPLVARNRALLIMGVRTGLRISELLSLHVSDVSANGNIFDRVYIRKSAVKGKMEGRSIPLHHEVKAALIRLLAEYQAQGKVTGNDCLFRSEKDRMQPLHRSTVWRIIRQAAQSCGIWMKIGTHSMRKTFADRMYRKLNGDLMKLQAAMGHARIDSTVQYLRFKQEEIDRAVLS
jgi:integrase